MWNGIGAVTDKELKLEDGDASHTPGGAGEGGTETFDMSHQYTEDFNDNIKN